MAIESSHDSRVSSVPESSCRLAQDTCLDNDGDAVERAANTTSPSLSVHLAGSLRQEVRRRDLNHCVQVSILFFNLSEVGLDQAAARDMALARETLQALDVGRQNIDARRRAHDDEEKRCCNAKGSQGEADDEDARGNPDNHGNLSLLMYQLARQEEE